MSKNRKMLNELCSRCKWKSYSKEDKLKRYSFERLVKLAAMKGFVIKRNMTKHELIDVLMPLTKKSELFKIIHAT